MYPPGGYCRSFLLFTTLAHFPSSTFLIFARELPLFLWERGKWDKKREAVHSQYCICLLHSLTSFIPHHCCRQSSGCLCSALNAPLKLCWEVVQTPPNFASFYIGSSFLSQPSSLTAFPLHPRVIKRATCLPLSPPVFSFFIPFLCSDELKMWMSWLAHFLHQDQSELLGAREVGLNKLHKTLSPWSVLGILVLSWEPMKGFLTVLFRLMNYKVSNAF